MHFSTHFNALYFRNERAEQLWAKRTTDETGCMNVCADFSFWILERSATVWFGEGLSPL